MSLLARASLFHDSLDRSPKSPRWRTRAHKPGYRQITSVLDRLEDRTLLSFNSAMSFPTGSEPASVAVGDFNDDGKLDIVTANWGSTVSVLLGNGNGTFQTAVQYSTGTNTNPVSVAVGDFNGGGKLGIVTANGDRNTVSVLLGNGNGTFQPAVQYSTGTNTHPVSVAVGDLTGDGEPDLVTANWGANDVSVLMGNGDGTFEPAVPYTTGRWPSSVAVGDLTGDGDLDLVIVNGFDVNVLLGNGDGTFQAELDYPTDSDPSSVAVGDFNGDGKLDLVTGNGGGDAYTVSMLLGNGDGSFQPSVDYATGLQPSMVAVGDFNGDGELDIVTADSGSNHVSVLLGNGNGTFQPAVQYAVGSEPESVAVGDFNNDGELDIVTANCGNDTVSVLLGNGNGTFRACHSYVVGSEPESVAVGTSTATAKPTSSPPIAALTL